jgi:hypothetical protein
MRTPKNHTITSGTIVAALLLIIIAAGNVFGMPPYPGDSDDPNSISKAQALRGQYLALQDGWREKGIDQAADIDFENWLKSSATASKNILCILVQFPDLAPITTATYFDTLIYENQSGSVRHFYNEISFNQLDIVTVDLPSDKRPLRHGIVSEQLSEARRRRGRCRRCFRQLRGLR